MDRRFQFSTRTAFVVTAWLAAWCGNWAAYETDGHKDTWQVCLFAFMLVAIPAAAVGAIAQRQRLGLVCGVASGIALVAVVPWQWRLEWWVACIFELLLVFLPAAAVGAIAQRQRLGLLCGVASGVALVAFFVWLRWLHDWWVYGGKFPIPPTI